MQQIALYEPSALHPLFPLGVRDMNYLLHRLYSNKRPRSASGVTLPELLVIVVIIGVIGSVGIQGFFFLVRRARVQSVALEVAGWLEQVRNAAADEVTATRTAGGCLVTFQDGVKEFDQSNPANSTTIATVDAGCTLPESVLRVPPSVQQDSVTIETTGSPFAFTPRGLWIDDDTGNPGSNFLLTIRLSGSVPVRCVRLSPVLGTVEIGRPPNSAGATCNNWQTL